MNRIVPTFALAAGLLAVFAGHGAHTAVPDRTRRDAPVTPHGVAVNGLRLEIKARFVPEQDGWGSPQIEKTVTFHNETDATICLDGYSTYHSLVLAHISPSHMVREYTLKPPIFCGAPIDEKSLIRIAPKRKHEFTTEGWCSSFSIPSGRIVEGRVVDDVDHQIFELLRTGHLTLAYVYRSPGPLTAIPYLQKFLAAGEKFWSGRVYSNPVTIHVSELRPRVPRK